MALPRKVRKFIGAVALLVLIASGILLAIALVVLAIWFQSRWALLIISTIYVAHGIVGKLWSLVKPRRAAAELELDRKPQR